MTPEEKAARKAAREIKKAAEEAAEHREFLELRDLFHSRSPYEALEILARAEQYPLVHTKVTRGSHPRKDRADDEYVLVQFWTGDQELEADLYVWKDAIEDRFEFNNKKWEFQYAMAEFYRYEEKLMAQRVREQKRRELLERLTAEERELLGLQT